MYVILTKFALEYNM